ncbi:MAG: patatin family protein [Caloramator sp.]|jgi:NTE family protein|uniref:patatin-like phospholipase family protein n=1 Tax=Caloramator sp. TaxID=1871330 RepID=UPI001D65F473|nr:patatin-like phospholipase family protein [Caloramator sp.]MBZ4663804.1 patatin family protein [Caloramator sp.]
MYKNLKIGLALGSGASRGLAHIGVIEVLEKYGIIADAVSGSSIGSVIGALYCSGFDFKYAASLCKNLNKKTYIDVAVPRLGFIKGERICEIIKLLTKDKEFKDLNKKFFVVATDLKSKRLVVFEEGKIYEAIRASISIPGVFIPVYKDNMVLVDGGVLERVPAKILKNYGVDYVIGVDVGFNLKTSNCKSIFHVLYESIDLMEKELFELKKQEADKLIRVDIDDVDPIGFDHAEETIEKGRQAAIKEIEGLIKELDSIAASRQDLFLNHL